MPLGMGEKITWHTTGTQTTQTKKGGHRDHRSKCLPFPHLPQCPARDSNPEPTD